MGEFFAGQDDTPSSTLIATAFASGTRNGVRIISTLSLANTVSKLAGNVVSRSWMRKRLGTAPSWICQLRWRACWVTPAAVGFTVQPARWTRRVPSSMKKSTSMVRKESV